MHYNKFTSVARKKHEKQEHLYVLYDGACEDNGLQHLFRFEGVKEYKSLYLNTPYAALVEYGPVLAAVASPSSFLQWFWDESPAIHAGVLLFSPLAIASLARQLQEIIEIRLPDGPKSLFRFYDPRVFSAAFAIAQKNGSKALSSNISEFYLPRYSFGEQPVWEKIVPRENSNG